MKNNHSFDKFKSKLTFEAILKSALAGLSVGLLLLGVISLICWLCGYKDGIWIALGVGAGVAVAASFIFYFAMFRPTQKQTGQRVDGLGLEERAVTMLEFEGDESFMATRQRSDAVQHIETAKPQNLKITVPNWLSGLVSGAAVFAITFSLVCGLYSSGVVKSPAENGDPLEDFVSVTYIAEEGGEIDGETDQLWKKGEDATSVTAVAMDGYTFVGWSDGNKNPGRTDLKITEDLEVTAQFEALNSGDNPEDGDFDGPGEKGDSATDQPMDGSESDGAEGDEGDGQGSPGNSEGSGSGQEEGEGKGDGEGEGAGGKWSQGNKVIDGETYYRDWLEQYSHEAMQEITSLEDLPPEIREFIEAYFESV